MFSLLHGLFAAWRVVKKKLRITMDGKGFISTFSTDRNGGILLFGQSQSFTPVEFVKSTGDYHDVKLRVMTTGRIKGYDRTFRVVVDKDRLLLSKG